MNCLPPFLRCRFHSRLAVLLDAVVFDSTGFTRAVTLCHFDKNVSFALLFIFSLTLDTDYTFLTFLLLKARQVDLDFGKNGIVMLFLEFLIQCKPFTSEDI